MISRHQLGLIGRVAVSLGLVAAACGGTGSDESGNTTTTSIGQTTSDTTTPPPSSVDPSSATSDAGTSTTATTAVPQVLVFFSSGDGSDCSLVASHARPVGAGVDPIEGAFTALVAGPTDEEVAGGASSFFSAATADSLRSVGVDNGLLVVDFADFRATLPNASTSCGSAALLAQLNATAFSFPMVERVRYEIEGSCETFWNWLQRECTEVGRGDDASSSDAADGSGCSPGTDVLPAGRWYGLVEGVTDTDLAFDLACWFSGDAAVMAAAEDGAESPPPNDYYVRNERDVVRQVPVSARARVMWLPNPSDPSSEIVSDYESWVVERPSRSFQPGVWITINDEGQAVEITEQYTP